MMVIPVFLSALIVCGVCIVLVLNKDYEDGLFGRIALAMIGVCAAARVFAIIEGGLTAYVSPVGTLLWIGLALFFGRHLFYFLNKRRGRGGIWREADPRGTAGKMNQG